MFSGKKKDLVSQVWEILNLLSISLLMFPTLSKTYLTLFNPESWKRDFFLSTHTNTLNVLPCTSL